MKLKLKLRAWLLIAMIVVLGVDYTLTGTFAWFSDTVEVTENVVAGGNLDAVLQWADGKQSPDGAAWQDASKGQIFDYDKWEPGYVAVRHLHVENAGTLAFKYQLTFAAAADVTALADVIDVYVVSPAREIKSRQDLSNMTPVCTLTEALSGTAVTTGEQYLLSGQGATMTIALKMREEAGNEYQNLLLGSGVAVQLMATQYAYEEDSFGKDYDAEAVYDSNFTVFSATADIPGVDSNGRLTRDVVIGSENDPVHAIVPAGVKVTAGAKQFQLNVVRGVGMSAYIPIAYDEDAYSLDVHIDGVADNNDTPITVYLRGMAPVGLKATSVSLFHVEDGEAKNMKSVSSPSSHNQYQYDPETGNVTMQVVSFSHFVTRIAATNPWNGTVDSNWYNTTKNNYANTEFSIGTEEELAAFGQLVAEGYDFDEKVVKLTANLDLGGETQEFTFYPIGYVYNASDSNDTLHPFKGTFDGQGHAIDGLYQNTWNIKGHYDNGYYKKSFGLFALLEDATVQNLILDHIVLESELGPAGPLAGRVNGGTFKDISVFSSHPAAYNHGVGGLLGYDWSDGAEYWFENITIDSSNTISALWGTYDGVCGGVLGFLSEASHAYFKKCSIGAVMDVYNDVCGNYQYYQYRYSGMLVGTVGEDRNPDSNCITCEECTVWLGSWRYNYYCEFEKNSIGSYTEDYQFSRISADDLVFENGKVAGCKHEHTANEDKQAVYLPFSQLYTGYGWGASPVFAHDGVDVFEYIYTVTYMDGADDVLGVDYVVDNSKTFTVDSDAERDQKEFDYWVNASSAKVTEIKAENVLDMVLYANWKLEAKQHIARFIDHSGNLIYECVFTEGKNIDDSDLPAPPTLEDFSAVWGPDYQNTIKNAKSDVTIRPFYTYDGILNLAPVDEDKDGEIDYYVVNPTGDLSGPVKIPGYVNQYPVKTVNALTQGFWDVLVDAIWGSVTQITVNEGTERLEERAFAHTKSLKAVELPKSLKYIGANAFSANTAGMAYKEMEITFKGTVEEWNAITKASGWDAGLKSGSTVKCTNGTLTLERSWGNYTWK